MGQAGKSGGGVRASVSAAASAMPPAKSGRTAVHAHSSAPGNEGEAPPDQVHHRHAEDAAAVQVASLSGSVGMVSATAPCFCPLPCQPQGPTIERMAEIRWG